MSNKVYKKFKKEGTDQYFEMIPYSADTAYSAATALDAAAIGNVEKYSGFYNEKQREGLKFKNGLANGIENSALIELNSKGNFSIEALNKHLNLESVKGVQIKPSTTIILDSSRRIETNKGNEINLEAKFDDYGDRTDSAYNGKDGYDESFAEFKIKGRSIDLRCHGHGGIALQIAGDDGDGHENKIKFESNRTSNIGASPTYSGPRKGVDTSVGEGGKGLEFGTFNNEHASLYCGDYRFKSDAYVYAATRGALQTSSTGKIDYPTQSDDFKDVLDNTKRATWEDIISAAKKCRDLEQTVNDLVAEAALDASGIDTSGFALKSELEDMVAQAMQDAHIDTTGLATETWVNSQGFFKVPDTVTLEPEALANIKMGNKKGNFTVDVTGKYTWELTSPKFCTAMDEYDRTHSKGERVLDFSNEAFYTDENKVYYKAGTATTLADGVTEVPAGTIVFGTACADVDASVTFPEGTAEKDMYEHYVMAAGDTSFYEDPTKFMYKCLAKKNKTFPDYEGVQREKGYLIVGAGLSQEAIDYYESKATVYDEDGTTVLVEGEWERVDIWKKSTLWTVNEININLETDSKIKFAGKKIETVWTYEENGEDVDHKMAEILLSAEEIAADANAVIFEKKISKNGERSGQDTEIVYTYSNNVSDPSKTPDKAAFVANYKNKYKNTPLTDAEIETMYDNLVADGTSFEIRVKVSELLGLVSKVADLEDRIEQLEGGNS